jgi:hypothetical protein
MMWGARVGEMFKLRDKEWWCVTNIDEHGTITLKGPYVDSMLSALHPTVNKYGRVVTRVFTMTVPPPPRPSVH